MRTYTYRAVDKSGREIRGRIEAKNENSVVQRLQALGYHPTDVAMAKAGGAGQQDLLQLPIFTWFGRVISRGKVKGKHMTAFTRQLATLIGAGLPLLRCLQILEEQTESANLKRALAAMQADVEGGSSFSEALNRQPRVFDRLYVNMVRAGEIGGALEQVLNRLAEFAEKGAALRGKVKSAMTYPVVVIFMASCIVGFILWKIVPRFADIYRELGAEELPGPTQFLMDISQSLVDRWYYYVAAPFVFWFILKSVRKTQTGKYLIDRVKLRMPVFGKLFQKAAIARFARTFGTLLDTGVPLLQSLIIVKDTAGNEVVARVVVKIHESIRDGDTVSEPLRNYPEIFPPLVVHMVAVGEETGAIDQMMVKVAETYEREVDTMVEGLTSIIEPLLIVALGVIIGFVVVALYLPLFKVGEYIQ